MTQQRSQSNTYTSQNKEHHKYTTITHSTTQITHIQTKTTHKRKQRHTQHNTDTQHEHILNTNRNKPQ